MIQVTGSTLCTDWFSSEISPAYAGVYLTRMQTGAIYWRAWDGEDWHYASIDECISHPDPRHRRVNVRSPLFERAARHPCLDKNFTTNPFTKFKWRGLAQEPK